MHELPAHRILLVVLEDRRVRRLLPVEHDVEDRVQTRVAGQRLAQFALEHADCVRLHAAAVQDARHVAVPAEAPRIARAERLTLLHLELDPFTAHFGGPV